MNIQNVIKLIVIGVFYITVIRYDCFEMWKKL